jgi:hypothetical protein
MSNLSVLALYIRCDLIVSHTARACAHRFQHYFTCAMPVACLSLRYPELPTTASQSTHSTANDCKTELAGGNVLLLRWPKHTFLTAARVQRASQKDHTHAMRQLDIRTSYYTPCACSPMPVYLYIFGLLPLAKNA